MPAFPFSHNSLPAVVEPTPAPVQVCLSIGPLTQWSGVEGTVTLGLDFWEKGSIWLSTDSGSFGSVWDEEVGNQDHDSQGI
jgi:hypothetical protein